MTRRPEQVSPADRVCRLLGDLADAINADPPVTAEAVLVIYDEATIFEQAEAELRLIFPFVEELRDAIEDRRRRIEEGRG